MYYQSWDIVVVPFPFSDALAEKRRPALVVSSSLLAEQSSLYWLAMVTSAGNAGWPCDVAISDLGMAGLSSPSVIRPAKVATLQHERILRKTGSLAAADRREVASILRQYAARAAP